MINLLTPIPFTITFKPTVSSSLALTYKENSKPKKLKKRGGEADKKK